MGVGTNSVDHVFLVPDTVASIVGAGKARVSERKILCGGQTATAVCATAALGLRSGYAGAFGSNAEGELISRTLQRCGVDLTHTAVCAGPNREAIILVDPHGLRTVLWHRNEALTITTGAVRAAVTRARIVHVDDDDPETALTALQSAREASVPTTSDIEHATDFTERLISNVTYPILNEDLPRTLTGELDPERALRKLRRLNAGVLCMTMGERGAAALEDDRFHVSPAFRVNVTDTTGAGDVFRAGFIYGVLQRWDVPSVLRFANAAAAVSCTRLGAIPSVPRLGEVRSLLEPKAPTS
jgi:sugar/nucleoside kinase (ribokinase family)